MHSVIFKYPDETCVYQKLVDAVNALCAAEGKSCTCTSGYRSLSKQIIINKQKLNESLGNYQVASGAVYNVKGQCIAGAYGKSNHCFGIALDIDDAWFKALTNKELAKYGLIKSMDYELWHVELIETRKLTQDQKPAFYFQYTHNLVADGIAGPKTKEKAIEVLQCCHAILGLNYKTAEEAINGCMTKPSLWLAMIKTVPYFKSFVMNIVEKMGGRK